jgi:hypothetical protein
MPSFRNYIAGWIGQSNLKTFEISDGKVILETSGSSSEESSPSPSPSP